MMNFKIQNKFNAFLSIFMVLFLAALSFNMRIHAENAVIKEEKQVFKTYPFSDPDPVPRVGRIYPYFRFDGYSHSSKNREWKMVTLENPYIKVWVTPEIGGKVWGAVEKSTNRAFVYFNKVVKFRDIAMRGPWTSGGIEFNFGAIGHTPTTSTPVDYMIKENNDGSVGCIVGAMDLPSRTHWRVYIRLPKDKAYFETQSSWYNPGPLRQSYYHWTNAAADTTEDLVFHYPGDHFIDHGGKAFPWPENKEGRNISIYKDNNFGPHKSYHVLGQYTEHFGGYWKEWDFGYGHWARYDDKPGKKLWLWALSRQGAIWKDLLTDDNNQYMEFQSGRLLNQAVGESSNTPFKHAEFAPNVFDRWNEIWFPIKGIGGMVNSTPYGSLNVSVVKNKHKNKHNNKLEIGVCALRPLDDPLVVTVDGNRHFSKHLKMKPMEVYRELVDLPSPGGNIEVTVGKNKLKYGSTDKKDYRFHRPLVTEKGLDWRSAEGLFLKGDELARQRNHNEALNCFLQCLQKEGFHVRALTRTAGLYFRRGEYGKGLKYAKKALSVDAYDAGANFIYGLINGELGRVTDAKDGFGWAARSMEYRSAAYAQTASLYLKEKNVEAVEEYARRGLDFNRYNLACYELQALAYRLRNKKQEAETCLGQLLEIDPLNHFARFEFYLLNRDEKNKKVFTSMIRGELPHETYLELAMTYINRGLHNDALTLLELAPPYPTVDYLSAYLLRKNNPEKSRAHLTKALKASPELVFPFRRETIRVLQWAVKENGHWKSTYYLALILWNNGRTAEARDLLNACEERPDFSPFYIARGLLWQASPDDKGTMSEKDFKKAVQIDKNSWRAGHTLTAHYMGIKSYALALRNAENIYKKSPGNYILAMDYAGALLENGKYKNCLSILAKTTILPYEGAREGRNLYRQANLLTAAQLIKKGNGTEALTYIADARRWPENLGVGKPYDTDEGLENYLEKLCRGEKELTPPSEAKDSRLVEMILEILKVSLL